jgi:hypothetical protein
MCDPLDQLLEDTGRDVSMHVDGANRATLEA